MTPPANPGAPRVTVLSMGGTIASVVRATREDGVVPVLEASDLVATTGDFAGRLALEARSVRRMPSSSFAFADVLDLVGEVQRALDEGSIGVVVTQGTDNIEETAFVLDLLIDDARPVVVTGAMRSADAPGADGPANVRGAILTAASITGVGTVVVMDDQIHAARFVRKTHASRPSAFASPGAGPLGAIVEDRVRLLTRVGPLSLGAPVADVPPVALLRCALGDDGRLVAVLRDQGYAGLVVEGMGGGHVPGVMVDALARLAEEVPVVLASRTGAGSTLERSYGFVGSEIELLARGLRSAGSLDGLKARVALALALGSSADPSLAARRFSAVVAAVG